MSIAIQPNVTKEQPKCFLIGANVLKTNDKDVLRAIRFTFEWIKTFFENLKDSMPIKNIISFTKGGEDALSFNEFGQSFFKMCHCVTTGFRYGVTNTVTNLSRGALDLTWNFFKVCKSLQHYKIFNFASRFFVNLSAIAGISFAISSADRALIISKDLLRLENKKNIKNKDVLILCNLYSLAKNIGTFAIGAIVAANALIGFAASTTVMLILGTGILISSISASIIKETYHLQVNHPSLKERA